MFWYLSEFLTHIYIRSSKQKINFVWEQNSYVTDGCFKIFTKTLIESEFDKRAKNENIEMLMKTFYSGLIFSCYPFSSDESDFCVGHCHLGLHRQMWTRSTPDTDCRTGGNKIKVLSTSSCVFDVN